MVPASWPLVLLLPSTLKNSRRRNGRSTKGGELEEGGEAKEPGKKFKLLPSRRFGLERGNKLEVVFPHYTPRHVLVRRAVGKEGGTDPHRSAAYRSPWFREPFLGVYRYPSVGSPNRRSTELWGRAWPKHTANVCFWPKILGRRGLRSPANATRGGPSRKKSSSVRSCAVPCAWPGMGGNFHNIRRSSSRRKAGS